MLKTFDPTTLRLFVAVCEDGSLALAAQREAMVASALSKRISALEAAVGVPLLTRHRRGVVPTPAGEALLRQSREVLVSLDRLGAEMGQFRAGAQGIVRVLASTSALAEQLPDDIAGFLRQTPGVRVTLDERVSPDIVRTVRDGAADLGVLWDRGDLSGLQARPYRSDNLCVAMAPSHRLARRPNLRFADTLDEVSVSVAAGGLMENMLRRQSALLGRTPSDRIQVSSMDVACRIVAAGLGLAILPQEAAAPHAGAGRLRLVPLLDSWARRQFVIASRPEALMSASARLLARYLQECAAAA